MSFVDSLLYFISAYILSFLVWIIIIGVVMSWLINFNVINTHNQFVSTIWRITNAITEPLVSPIRRFVPPIGGIDFSALILLFGIYFLQVVIIPALARAF